MGTDIHLQVQGRRPDDGVWEFVKRKPFLLYGDEGLDWGDDPTGRNYDVFAFLADVRNGFGFAGVYRHEPVKPQFPHRGLPADYYPSEGQDENESYEDYEARRAAFTAGDVWVGDHSFTWATLKELRDAPWDDVEFKSGGIVGPDDFKVWKHKGMPDSWSSGISGPGIVVHDDPADFATLLAEDKIRYADPGDPALPGRPLDFCRVYWTWNPVKDSAFRRWVDSEVMTEIADEYGGPENVRVVMGFDS